MSRLDKVNQQLIREISMIIQRELADPRLMFVTIIKADVSKDLRHAKIYYSVLGGQVKADIAQKSLDGARGIIRKYVGEQMKIRFTPELVFVYDDTLEFTARIDETLKEINDESSSS